MRGQGLVRSATTRWLAILIAAIGALSGPAAPVAAQDGAIDDGRSAPTVDPDRLRGWLRAYARRDPPVRRVVERALAASASDPTAAEELASRARTSGWLPTVRLGVRRGQGTDQSELSSVDSDRTNVSTDDELSMSAWVTFRLDRIAYSGQEPAWAREERARHRDRWELVRTVVQVFFQRRRLMLERDLMGRDDLPHALAIAEAEALLDGFTDGWFSRIIADR